VRYELFPAEEVKPGEVRRVEIGGLNVAVARLPNGEFRALFDRCPHMGAPLSIGWLGPMVVGDRAGAYAMSDRFILRCPWHHIEFDVDTGRCPADPKRTRVRAYGISVIDGVVVLDR
jgi:nitrite reductase (NADH) small subunit